MDNTRVEYTLEDDLLESYDKEWALTEEAREDGKEKEKLRIAKELIKKNVALEIISETTGHQ